ncbi:fungal zn(2)-cys(6) binuclear cluster domain protein [Rhizoctonia solani AG-3 Rhs1AP]|uniref:Fungal zn(2)-cys(6) binuclear cluster domain protein n=2 Tax=Rhizoctonia solani AG-3 TaxID=1086053 RepID=A0A074SBS3_9AGAM|nr:fungal zn(2)-cys(6) binuclear cluster domain protein [Rhizoctonia solani AG-3 Rhs1AP]KEP47467.1 fungal zn(2)-cys(6) binuclear cluster domain protein [Rhizoctonia solani 123E]
MSTFQNVAGLYVQLPRHTLDPLKTFLNNPLFDEYLLLQHAQLVNKWYFKPIDIQKQLSRDSIVSVLQSPVASVSRWIALIGLGIYEAFIKGDASHDRLHGLWMEYIGGLLRRELSSDSTMREVQTRRRDFIHVSLLRTLVIHSSNVYQVLRSVTPAFLQSVFSNPALWPEGSNPAYIPLMSVLSMGSHELAYFALIDCACATAFGLPQLVEYDTTLYTPPGSSSHQWAHCSPTEFQVVLAEINACRDKSPVARDWREIERWLLEWQSRPGEHTFTESWMTVAWYAVQESWRLALLIYLYLAVCDTPSDNPQIQSYLKQILWVIGTVNKQGSDVNISFFIHHLIVGICARSEAHRKAVRDKLSAGTRFWLNRASDFAPVLDHLWHGAGANGRPVRWCDYMRSREAILPVV